MQGKTKVNKIELEMKKMYKQPQVEMYEVASEMGFVQSGFDAGFVVPGGGNKGGADDWAY